MKTDEWRNAETARNLLEDRSWLKQLAFPKVEKPKDDEPEKVEQEYTVEVSGRRFDVKVIGEAFAGGGVASAAPAAAAPKPRRGERKSSGGGGGGDTLESPLQGNVWKILVEAGQQVEEGQLVTIIEAMKMENEITAHKAGVIAELPIKEGTPVAAGDTLAIITSNGAS